eukprot:gnl/TRDRNA2_/TRDRNA2_70579_c0_seq1.p1 gnl/TRDRNA2_/TRDRNA2_70579_c0~~gnl/TRDRNA2_/TRDRNA2_70579_c0_seq1.p1  ORF type:complete len:215 (+),score=39.52 gnl/TRDRNA2_/TRDRNA2_70579_c0_seq1:58-702(+)
MAYAGTVKSFNPHKGWGFITGDDGTEYFLMKHALNGFHVAKGTHVTFNVVQGTKGANASDVTVVSQTSDGSDYEFLGEVKSFDANTGYGFLTGEAVLAKFGRDAFVSAKELPGGYAGKKGKCRFKIRQGAKGPEAYEVRMLGWASDEAKEMIAAQNLGLPGKGAGMMKDMAQSMGVGTFGLIAMGMASLMGKGKGGGKDDWGGKGGKGKWGKPY